MCVCVYVCMCVCVCFLRRIKCFALFSYVLRVFVFEIACRKKSRKSFHVSGVIC